MTTSTAQLGEEIRAKSEEIGLIIKSHVSDEIDVTGQMLFKESFPFEEFNQKERELSDLRKKFDQQRRVEEVWRENQEYQKGLNEPANRLPTPNAKGSAEVSVKSLGQLLSEHEHYKSQKWEEKGSVIMSLNNASMKTLMSTSAGFTPFVQRSNVVTFTPTRRPVVADLIPQSETDQNAVKYMEETTFTDNSSTVAEGATNTDSAFAYTERTSAIQKILAWVPVSEEQIADVPQVMSIVDVRLMLQLQLQEENQLINGAGSGNDLYGFLNPPFSGTTPNAAKSSNDDYFTAVMKMFTNIRTANGTSGVSGWAEPSGIIFHPTDWQTIITQKDTSGRFIYGDPSADPSSKTIWGVSPVVTAVIAQGTSLAGDFVMHSHITRRQGATLQVGFINDDFIKGRSAVKVTERLSLEIYRIKAFYKLTGL